ncbi:hypothetical protein ACFW9I_36165 [[Kitasatospora] papulosa]|uniref:hypothetical protein n=1 Tax=[Kitasatospora] papulosa TaxID=1464011 RepID=UPI0036BD1D58
MNGTAAGACRENRNPSLTAGLRNSPTFSDIRLTWKHPSLPVRGKMNSEQIEARDFLVLSAGKGQFTYADLHLWLKALQPNWYTASRHAMADTPWNPNIQAVDVASTNAWGVIVAIEGISHADPKSEKFVLNESGLLLLGTLQRQIAASTKPPHAGSGTYQAQPSYSAAMAPDQDLGRPRGRR